MVTTTEARAPQLLRERGAAKRRRSAPRASSLLVRFATGEAINTARHVAALRPFRRDEFGVGPERPSEAHIQAANQLVQRLRRGLQRLDERLAGVAETSARSGTSHSLQQLLRQKERADRGVKEVEQIWSFFLELFGQRQSRYADWLLAADRIALDCYQAVYTGLGTPRSVPSPPPFSYMETGLTPATFRRGIRLSRLRNLENPFPIVKLPYHRLVNPWTLGAVHHEVSHNIQSDLGLWQVVPSRIHRRLRRHNLAPEVARTWARWHKEIWADLCGLLLGGPALVASLISVLAHSPALAQRYHASGVHPPPYLRTLINLELLRRMGFTAEARAHQRLWHRLYPTTVNSPIPRAMLESFPLANRLVVDTICFQPYPQLGGKSLSQVVPFTPTHRAMEVEAAGRLASGTDPGIIPARFLVGATRWALDRRLASPEQIATNFYDALVRR